MKNENQITVSAEIACDPFQINHTNGITAISSGVYDIWCDGPTVFAFKAIREDAVLRCDPFTVCMPGTGIRKRVHVPTDCAVAVEIAVDASWCFYPVAKVELDLTPVETPLGMGRPLTIYEQMKRFIREEFSAAHHDNGYETFEESEDFEVDDHPEWESKYEVRDDIEDADPPPPTTAPQKVAGESDSQQGDAPPSGSKPPRKDNKSKALDSSEDD